jgi:tetratricopeptide (TPR) repeat protein
MTQQAAKLATDEILEKLTQYPFDGEYSEMDLKRIERNVIKLLDNGDAVPAYAQMLFGIIGYLSGDLQKTESGFKNALRLSPNEAIIHINAITGLSSLGNFREAIALIHALLERFPDDKHALYRAMINAEQILQPQLVKSIIERYDKLSTHGDTQNISRFRETTDRSRRMLTSSGFSDDDWLARLETAVEAVHTCGLNPRHISTFTLHDGSVIHNIYLKTDSMTCAEINFKIAEALFDNHKETGMKYLSIATRPDSDFPEVRAHGGTL